MQHSSECNEMKLKVTTFIEHIPSKAGINMVFHKRLISNESQVYLSYYNECIGKWQFRGVTIFYIIFIKKWHRL
ncbi:hypothetical protein T01_7762 [Trichinella spiralis]|uniref:Uncharacterized protein n=1 Tax=Trichinella spiralis TaxID=6334 RepID=A0A0V1BWH6_TRISP|nr:hypothetical protein T01_7762 [Trichinella spiralis]